MLIRNSSDLEDFLSQYQVKEEDITSELKGRK
jgi:hypothetical protein